MKVRYSYVLFLYVCAYAHMPPKFTTDVFLQTWEVNKKNPNIIVSPYSLIAPLGTIVLASRGESQKQLLKALNLKISSQVSEMFRECKQHISDVGDVVINTANRLYISHRAELIPEFSAAAQHIYDVEVKSADFSTPKKTAKEINEWVKNKTENRIKNLIQPSSLGPTTRAVLVNTIYFDGRWLKKFQKTDKRKFYAKSNTILVPTMKVEMRLKYGYNKKLQSEVLSIPYRDEKCSFVIVLPKKKTTIDRLQRIFKRNKDVVNYALKKLSEKLIELSMPMFEFETETDLKIVLRKLNVKDIFSSTASKLTMTKDDSNLFIDSAVQKAYIKVDEDGTQAAAANAFIVNLAFFIPTGKKVVVDRPFYFEIRCSAITLFNGIVRRP